MRVTPLQAIRQNCLDCCCGSAHEVKLCPCTKCPLYTFRFGRNPARAGVGGKGSSTKKPNSSTPFSAQNEKQEESFHAEREQKNRS